MVSARRWCGALAAVAMAGCAQDATALHVVVEAAPALRGALDGVRVIVRRPGAATPLSQRAFVRAQLTFPLSLTVLASDPDAEVEVTAEGFAASTTPVSVARLVTRYTLHETTVVPLVLYPGCPPQRCPMGTTCTALAATTAGAEGCEAAGLGPQDRAPYQGGVDAPCPAGQLRRGARCVPANAVPPGDAGVDGGGTDAGVDGGVDASGDAGADSGADAGTDAGPDVGVDSGVDAGTDSGTDVGVDSGVDAGMDVGVDSGVDAGMDVGVDGGMDGGADAGGACTSTCAGDDNCLGGRCDARPFESCSAILMAQPGAPSGEYVLVPRASAGNGTTPYRVWCDMTSAGGGWTLVLKANGDTETFLYHQPLWEDLATLRPDSADLSTTEAKLASYFLVPFTDLRVVFRPLATGGTDREAVMSAWGDGVRTVRDWMFVPTVAGRTRGSGSNADRKARWAALLPSSGAFSAMIPGQCLVEGFNFRTGFAPSYADGIRIGMLTTDQSPPGTGTSLNICATSVGRIGIGGEYAPCVIGATNAVGNVACAALPVNARDVRTFAWVFVR